MDIIFLDIDGVLNSEEYYENTPSQKIKMFGVDDKPLNLLLNLLEHSNVKIVLTSSWRCGTLLDTIRKFIDYGTNISKLTPYMIGVTKRTDDFYENGKWATRGHQIKHFMDDCEVPITQYCIIDDDIDMLKEQSEHFVHINSRVGLTKNDIVKIKNILRINE